MERRHRLERESRLRGARRLRVAGVVAASSAVVLAAALSAVAYPGWWPGRGAAGRLQGRAIALQAPAALQPAEYSGTAGRPRPTAPATSTPASNGSVPNGSASKAPGPAAASAPTSARATTASSATAPTGTSRTPATTVASSGTAAPSGALGSGRIQYGRTYAGDGTYYGATGAGNCMYAASSDLMVAAMNHTDYAGSQACGAYVSITGPSGSVTVKIVDQCPECSPGAIDLSAQAFAKIAAPSAGRVKISWHLLSPDLGVPVSYVYKSGSSRYWCGIQVRDHRNPIRSLEVKAGGSWRSLSRADYNYFLSEDGTGCGSDVRITDIYGNQLVDTGIAVTPDAVQRGHAQLAGPR